MAGCGRPYSSDSKLRHHKTGAAWGGRGRAMGPPYLTGGGRRVPNVDPCYALSPATNLPGGCVTYSLDDLPRSVTGTSPDSQGIIE